MAIAFVPHWQELLHNYFVRRHNEPFKWGSMDCCLFACDAVRELTGIDLAHDFRGRYDSALTAVREMKRFTGDATAQDDLVEAVAVKVTAQFGLREVPLLMAQRGDVVLLQSPNGKSLGILGLGGTRVHASGPDGVISVPLKECLRAWLIPKFAPVPVEATMRTV